MGLRFTDMAQLRKNISPDVEIEDDESKAQKTEARQAVEAAEKAVYDSLEDKFLRRWLELGGPELEREVLFDSIRKWRMDFAFIATSSKGEPVHVAFEIQGGIYKADSGHRSFNGVQRDYEKFNSATLQGWLVFQITSSMIKQDKILKDLIDFCSELCHPKI